MNSASAQLYHYLLSVICITAGPILTGGCAANQAVPELRASDTEIPRLAQQAGSLFEMQRPAQAVPLYQAALDRARALNDDALIARLAYNLGACLLESGDSQGACRAFEEAIYSAKAAKTSPAESQLLYGYALLELGEISQIFPLCSEAAESQVGPELRIRFQLLRTEAYLKDGKIDRAAETLQNVTKQGISKSAPAVQAQMARLDGELLSRRKAPSQSAEAFLREATFWSLANRPAQTVIALTRAADEQHCANNFAGEADSRYRAARALLGLERFVEATAQMEKLDAISQDQWPLPLKPRILQIRQEIGNHTR